MIPKKIIEAMTSGSALEDDQEVSDRIAEAIPTIWLLGKTGSGKSTFIKELTDICDIEIGNGYMPCTKGINEYHFPEELPILKLLDTQGLGEVGYDSNEDIERLVNEANIIVLLMKLDEPDQSEIIETLKIAKNKGLHNPLLILHTGSSLISEADVARMVALRKSAISAFWNEKTYHVEIDFKHTPEQINEAIEILSHILPLIKLKLDKKGKLSPEEKAFKKIENSLLANSTAAAAVALTPIAGPTLVLVVQGRALSDIAWEYELEWDSGLLLNFFGYMGASFVVQQLSGYAARTLLSAIPWVGSAVNATLAFGSTYALGRVFSLYMYRVSNDEAVTADELQSAYLAAFSSAEKSREVS